MDGWNGYIVQIYILIYLFVTAMFSSMDGRLESVM